MGKMKYWLIAGFIILLAIVYTAISDRDSTLSRLKSAGENGDVEAQYALGLMYLYGEILDVDYQQAKIWYEKAAAQNDPRAQAKLGVMYANGLGVKQDYQNHGIKKRLSKMMLMRNFCLERCITMVSG